MVSKVSEKQNKEKFSNISLKLLDFGKLVEELVAKLLLRIVVAKNGRI